MEPHEEENARLEEGQALHQQGQLAEAERIYVDVLSRDPGNPRALGLLGMIGLQLGHPAAAVDLISRALAAGPDAAMLANRAVGLALLGRTTEALADDEAALTLAPNLLPARLHHARMLSSMGRSEDAVGSYEAALALAPGHPEALAGRGAELCSVGRFEAAASDLSVAAAARPNDAVIRFNLGNALRLTQRVDDAIAAYDAATSLQPDFAMAHHNSAFCLLQRGDLAAGFAEYEWRTRCPTFDDPRYGLPNRWTGAEPLAGRTLFVFAELFMGDAIQICRYLRLAEQRGARVVFAAPAPLHDLMRSLSPTIELIGKDAVPDAFDLQCPMMSLPHAFGVTLADLPGPTNYLHPEPDRLALWRARIGDAGFRVGVVWQGSTLPYALPLQRSYPLAMLQEIAAIPGVRLISLQKINGLEQLDALPPGMVVETLGDDFDAGSSLFLDTAAAMACCDLVITLDTSTAHLAGALGVRTWVALPYIADWRWLMERSDSPWYPSARLFRQTVRGDWTAVFQAMAAELREEPGLKA